MWFNFFVAALVIAIPAIWSTKSKGYGAFSALLAAVCALAAGGIAFAVWEPASYLILGWGASASGFAGNLLQGAAFSLGLIAPFLISLVVLRVAVDSIVKSNLDLGDTLNMAGALVFGLMTSIICVGVLVIGIGYLPLPRSILGYAPIEERSGQVVYASKLWIPVDLAVARLYERLSLGAFGSPTPLAHYHPNIFEAAAMQRMTYGDASRNTIEPADFEVLGAYSLTGAVDELTKDTFQPKKQAVIYPDGSSPTGEAALVGYAIKFRSGSKEKGGNVVLTPGQLRLVCRDDTGDTFAIHPIAVIAPPEAVASGLYRFRFDAPEVFIASQGGGADAVFAFEFLLPRGFNPTQLLVKNTRVDLGADPKTATPKAFPNYQSRDKAVTDATLFSSFGVATPGAATATLEKKGSTTIGRAGGRFEGIEQGPNIPNGYSFSRNNKGTLELNEANEIVEGQYTFEKKKLTERGIEKSLRVENLAASKDTGIIKVQLSVGGARSIYGRSVEAAEAVLVPLLIDNRGSTYEPVGYMYEEGDKVTLRYTPGTPLRALSEAPALSRAKRDQTLILIFRPTKGVKITSLALGSKEIAAFEEGVEVR